MRLAARLSSGSLKRCQRETGTRQFYKWQQYFAEEDQREIERTEKWEHYLARFMALFLQANGVKTATEKDCLIKFQVTKAKKETAPVTLEQRIKESKAFWKSFFAVHDSVSAKSPKG